MELLNEEFIEQVREVLQLIEYTPEFTFSVIGSREALEDTNRYLYGVTMCALLMGGKGYSGGAEGPDEQLTIAIKEILKQKLTNRRGYELAHIYPGWFRFNGLEHGDLDGAVVDGSKQANDKLAEQIAERLHPAWAKLGPGSRALHKRNVYEILTYTLRNPVDVVFFAASDYDKLGRPLGGTATAWKLAQILNIPCFDCSLPEGRRDAEEWLLDKIGENQEHLDIFNRYVLGKNLPLSVDLSDNEGDDLSFHQPADDVVPDDLI